MRIKLRYTESHEWVQLEGKIATIGITDHAQKELGEIVYIELPQIGHSVKAGQEVCVLESTKAAADVYAPISGKIVEVNSELKSHPGQINQSAESKSWLFKIEVSNSKEFDHLLTKQQYDKIVK
jgi:glycine cleavage system H protein